MKRIFSGLICLVLIFPFVKVGAVTTSAKSAIVINGDTNEVIYEHNSRALLPMASTTKIMTALLLCENKDLEKEITVSAEMLRVEGSSMGLLAGDKVTLHDLLYGMMLSSGNDAANVTAYVLGGTVDGFVKKMNQKAEELGLKNTHFDTPSGLDGETHYTTAYDLSILASYAMKNEDFYKASSSKSARLYYGNPPYNRTLTNHNKLLKTFEGAVGVKTGFTKKSGRCLVSAAKRDGKFVIAVTLNDRNDWQDHTLLLNHGLQSLKLTEIKPEKENYSVSVIGGNEKLNVKIEPQTFSYFNNEDISLSVNLPRFVYAPIKKDEVIGKAVYKKNDEIIKEIPILANTDIEAVAIKPMPFDSILENFKYIFFSIWEK